MAIARHDRRTGANCGGATKFSAQQKRPEEEGAWGETGHDSKLTALCSSWILFCLHFILLFLVCRKTTTTTTTTMTETTVRGPHKRSQCQAISAPASLPPSTSTSAAQRKTLAAKESCASISLAHHFINIHTRTHTSTQKEKEKERGRGRVSTYACIFLFLIWTFVFSSATFTSPSPCVRLPYPLIYQFIYRFWACLLSFFV